MDDQTLAQARALAEALGETEAQPILSLTAIIARLGPEVVQEYLRRTEETEAAGGLRTLDGTCRRTRGGVFFFLVKQMLHAQGKHDVLNDLFPPGGAAAERADPPPVVLPRVWHGKRPDQTSINAILDHFLGNPPDLYRRSIDPATGATTLFFAFPEVAQAQCGDLVAQAAAVAQVDITIAPQVNQTQMQAVARGVLPETVTVGKISLHQEMRTVRVRSDTPLAPDVLAAAQQAFTTRTGWRLEVVTSGGNAPASAPAPAAMAWVSATAAPLPAHQPVPAWVGGRGLVVAWVTDDGAWMDAQGQLDPPQYWLRGAVEHLPPDAQPLPLIRPVV